MKKKLTLVNVGEDTTLGNGDVTQELVQLLIVAHSQLDVTGSDARTLVIACSIASQLQNLGSQVLQHCTQVHGGTATDASTIATLTEEAGYTAYRELQTSACAAGLGLATSLRKTFKHTRRVE